MIQHRFITALKTKEKSLSLWIYYQLLIVVKPETYQYYQNKKHHSSLNDYGMYFERFNFFIVLFGRNIFLDFRENLFKSIPKFEIFHLTPSRHLTHKWRAQGFWGCKLCDKLLSCILTTYNKIDFTRLFPISVFWCLGQLAYTSLV